MRGSRLQQALYRFIGFASKSYSSVVAASSTTSSPMALHAFRSLQGRTGLASRRSVPHSGPPSVALGAAVWPACPLQLQRKANLLARSHNAEETLASPATALKDAGLVFGSPPGASTVAAVDADPAPLSINSADAAAEPGITVNAAAAAAQNGHPEAAAAAVESTVAEVAAAAVPVISDNGSPPAGSQQLVEAAAADVPPAAEAAEPAAAAGVEPAPKATVLPAEPAASASRASSSAEGSTSAAAAAGGGVAAAAADSSSAAIDPAPSAAAASTSSSDSSSTTAGGSAEDAAASSSGAASADGPSSAGSGAGPAIRLLLQSGAAMLPHPDKAHRGGEDSFFIADHQAAVGVADGVGGWAEIGVDAGAYARLLMVHAKEAADAAAADVAAGTLSSQAILESAFYRTNVQGSSTACVLVVNGTTLSASNLGDSGFVLVRDGQATFQCPQQQHNFNFPFQLGSADSMSDQPQAAMRFDLPLQPGDIIVTGSDGLWDNIFAEEAATIASKCREKGESPTIAAQVLCRYARMRASDAKYHSPFSYAAIQAGYVYLGGKMDDITVLVSYVGLPPPGAASKL